MEITHEMIRQAWLAAHSVETEDRCNNEMLRRAIAAVVPLIHADLVAENERLHLAYVAAKEGIARLLVENEELRAALPHP